MIANNILELIGNTPLMFLHKIQKKYNLECEILCKIEKNNPIGSIKDRSTYNMIKKALEDGLIDDKTIFIEPTSGNTGIALSAIGAYLNNRVILVMPENVSVERIKTAKMYGAEVILTPKAEGMVGATKKANELLESVENSFSLKQFSNPNNALAHQKTAMEIYDDLQGKVDGVFSGIGTGGTIVGIAETLKQLDEDIKIIGIEPAESPMISLGKSGVHKIQGIGANFIPDILNIKLIDEIITVSSEEALLMAKEICRLEGLFVGISSGASLAGMIKYIKKNNLKNKRFVCIFPDGGEKYLSTELVDYEDSIIKQLKTDKFCSLNSVNRGEIIRLLNELRKIIFIGYFDEPYDDCDKYLQEKICNVKNILDNELVSLGYDSFQRRSIIDKFINELVKIKKQLLNDVDFFLQSDPAATSIDEVIISYPGIYAISIYRIAHELYLLGIKQIPRIMSEYAHSKTGIDIHPGAKIGNNFFIDHGTGIVIGETTEIGKNVKIYQGVTLGALSLKNGKSLKGIKRHPTIKDNVTIYAGASILGGDTIIGTNCTIGSNVFITSSVEDNKTVILVNQEINQKIK